MKAEVNARNAFIDTAHGRPSYGLELRELLYLIPAVVL